MKRLSIIVALVILAAGVPAALWLYGLTGRSAESARMATILQAEKERQRREVSEEIALRQKQLDERNLAEARRIAEQDRLRREAAIMQALQKQQQQEQERRLADAERQLEQDRARHAEIVQASLRQRQEDEQKRAEAQRAAEAARQQRLAAEKLAAEKLAAEKEAAARKKVEDSRLAEAQRQLELERVRQAMVVQASMQQRQAEEQKLAAVAPAAPAAAKNLQPEVKHVAATGQSIDTVPRAKLKPAGRSAKRQPARTAQCSARCRAVGAARHASPYARFDAMIARALTDFCPLRWLDRVLTELGRPHRVG